MFTFGSDPEFMLWKNAIFYSAIGIVPGTKKDRHVIDGCSFYYDNVLAECTIEPSSSKDGTLASIGKALGLYSNLVKPYYLVPKASLHFNVSQLNNKEALEAGCDPEWCAYTLEEKKPDPKLFLEVSGHFQYRPQNTLRSCGGHIHLGSDIIKTKPKGHIFTTRMLDLFLGVPSILLDRDPTSPERRKIYGKAGRYRKPKHGVEYRSLGNFWLASPKLTGLVYDICEFVLSFIEADKHMQFWEVDEERLNDDDNWNDEDFNPADCHVCHGYDLAGLRDAIDNSNEKKALELMSFIKGHMPSKLYRAIEELADHPEFDMYEEWRLK